MSASASASVAAARPSFLAPYLGLFRMRLVRGLAYRAAAAAGVATQFFWGFIMISVFQAFARAGLSPLDPREIASYVWLQQAFLVLVVVWFRDAELIRLITTGDAAYELVRPVDLYAQWYARLLGGRLAGAALRSLPILLVAGLFPEPWRFRLPPDLAQAGLAFLALALAAALTVAVSLFAYILALVTLQPYAAFILLAPLAEFCSGLLVPLPFLPDALRRVLELLPFRAMLDLPARLWSGSLTASDSLRPFALGLAWLLVLVPLGRAALSAALRARDVPGG